MARFILNDDNQIVMKTESGDVIPGQRELLLILRRTSATVKNQDRDLRELRNTIACLRESVGKLSDKNHALDAHCKALEKMMGE